MQKPGGPNFFRAPKAPKPVL
uniref:Uncharacterized protein n=1 Tax=Anguilla anguilla TaxID=7936 RepID=A0A0E9QFP5_ANGAN